MNPIQLRNPGEFFAADALAAARASGAVSGLICGHGGESWQAPRNPAGKIMGSRLFHICRDTEWGAVLRSHFFLGWDLPVIGKSPEDMSRLSGDQTGPVLLAHWCNECSFLARFLPSLFIAENRATQAVALL